MDARKYECLGDFVRHCIALGRAEGEARGRAEGEIHGRSSLVIRLLTSRFGRIDSQTEGRIQKASIAELEVIGERLLTARTLLEALGPP